MSPNIFKASNGIVVRVDGFKVFTGRDGLIATACMDFQIHSAIDEAFSEWYQHRRDEELGRWRDPDRPNEVVYLEEDGCITVLDEVDGGRSWWTRGDALDASHSSYFGFESARAYYAAHPEPEPRPWEEAQTGEVWLLTTDGVDEPWTVLHAGYLLFWSPTKAGPRNMGLPDPRITAGRRIWPEAGDESLAVLDRIREAVKGHPQCDVHPDGGPISCGWKRAYTDVLAALKEGDNQ